MKLSLVIPAYNEAPRIGRCLEAICRELQGSAYPHEVIVVDNASTDDTGEIAASFPGVIVVREPRKGITFARQAGFERTTGDLVANIDADTRLTPGWVERVFREFAADPALVCLSGPQVYDDVPWSTRLLGHMFYGLAYATYLVNRFVLRAGSLAQGGNFVCRRDALERIGGFDTRIQFYGEDADVAQRLHPLGNVKFTFGLPIYASGRRLAVEGVLLTGLRYSLNYLWIVLFQRPFTLVSRDIRPVL